MPNYGHYTPFAYNLPVLTYKDEYDTCNHSSVLHQTKYQEHPQYQQPLVQNLTYLHQHQPLRPQQEEQQQHKYFQHFFHHQHLQQQAASYQTFGNFYLHQTHSATTQIINDASFAPAYSLQDYNHMQIADMKKRQLTLEEENLIRLELEQQRSYLRSLYAQQSSKSQMLSSQQEQLRQQQQQPSGIFRPFQVLHSNTIEPPNQAKSKAQHIYKPMPIDRSRPIIDNVDILSSVSAERMAFTQDRSSQFNSTSHAAPYINTQLKQTAQYSHPESLKELTIFTPDINNKTPAKPFVTSPLSLIPIATKESIFSTLTLENTREDVKQKVLDTPVPHHLLRLPSAPKSQNQINKVTTPLPATQSPKIVETYYKAKMSQELLQVPESSSDESDDDDSSVEFNSNELPIFEVQVDQITPFWPKPLRKPVMVEQMPPIVDTMKKNLTKIQNSQRQYVNLFDRVNSMLKQLNDRYSEAGPLSSTQIVPNTKPIEEREIKKAVRRTIAAEQEIGEKPISSMQKSPCETELDSALQIYPKREERENGVVYVLGPNGTTVTSAEYNEVHWSTAPIATRILLLMVFTSNELSTHTLSGKPSPAFYGRERPSKIQLDPKRVEDIIVCVRNKTGGKERHIRATITTKCSETAKKYKRRALVAARKRLNVPATLQD